MTEIEQKALALVNEVTFGDEPWTLDDVRGGFVFKALCRAIEQHEQFKREVSDAIQSCMLGPVAEERLSPFILPKPKPKPKPDPLVAVMDDFMSMDGGCLDECVKQFRVALARQGLEVREIEQ